MLRKFEESSFSYLCLFFFVIFDCELFEDAILRIALLFLLFYLFITESNVKYVKFDVKFETFVPTKFGL